MVTEATIQQQTKNGSGWNEAIHPETKATDMFAVNDKEADNYRKWGLAWYLVTKKMALPEEAAS